MPRPRRESSEAMTARAHLASTSRLHGLGRASDRELIRARESYVDAKALDFVRQILALPVTPHGRSTAAALLINDAA